MATATTTTTSLASSAAHHRLRLLPSSRSTASSSLRVPNRGRLCPGFPSVLCASSSSPSSPQPTAGGGEEGEEEEAGRRLSKQSSWEAKDSEGDDYLYRLGKEADNMNIAVGARSGIVDDLFVGNFLGKDSDIVFDYRQKATRTFEYLQGDYYIAPLFLDKVACHIVKNYLAHVLNIKIPLILGIWGGKGQGKTFQTELIFRTMGVEPVIMSAGELESEKAGQRNLNLCLLFACFTYSAIFFKVDVKGLLVLPLETDHVNLSPNLFQENLGGLYVTDTGQPLK